jgi:xanthine dehydrogenase accessory factor
LCLAPCAFRIFIMFSDYLVGIKGGGDIATGVAFRLFRSGFPVFITELPKPLVVRRTVSFAEAIFSGETVVEGVKAVKVETAADIPKIIRRGDIPVLIDPDALSFRDLGPVAIVDAMMAKKNTGTKMIDAKIVIGVGPGFQACLDVHAVIETNRGHDMGRVIWEGSTEEDTGTPSPISGYAGERVLRAPCSGIIKTIKTIGERIETGEIVAHIGESVVKASISGILRGIVHNGVELTSGVKLGDIDPRGKREYCYTISDKALAVGGGVLEAILILIGEK